METEEGSPSQTSDFCLQDTKSAVSMVLKRRRERKEDRKTELINKL